jgi:CubicO group peptidase (beta-lactamase class C family)
MTKSLFLFLISFLLLTSSFGQSRQDKKIAKSLDELIPKRLTEIAPGCVVLVAKDDKIIYRKAFGSANTELNIPMQPEMLFRIGSMTKQYTAIAVLQLVEQGKIRLQESISKTFHQKAIQLQ